MNARGVFKVIGLMICFALLSVLLATDSFALTKEEIDVSVKASLDRFDKQVKGAKDSGDLQRHARHSKCYKGRLHRRRAIWTRGTARGWQNGWLLHLAAGSLGYQIGARNSTC